jgi:hypothetical protein
MDPRNDSSANPDESQSDATAERINNTQDVQDDSVPASEPAPVIPELIFPEDEQPRIQTQEADFSTVGTGSVFAISCSLLTILIIVICVGFFILTRLF